MNLSRRNILGFLALLLTAITVLSGCIGGDMRAKNGLNDFTKLIEQGKLIDTRLTIYYMSPYIFTLYPCSVDDLTLIPAPGYYHHIAGDPCKCVFR